MTLTELNTLIRGGQQVQVEIRSFEPTLYLVFHRADGVLYPLVDDGGNTLRYFSREAAMKALRATDLQTVEFVHQSAYCEMIGTDQGTMQDSELRERIRLA